MTAFYLDEDMAIALPPLLRARGHRATDTHAEGMDSARDYTQLLYAARREWVLVTHNLRDFRLLHGAWLAWAFAWASDGASYGGVLRHHTGILVVAQLPSPRYDEIVAAIDALARDPTVVIENALHEWNPRTGWAVYH